VRDSRFAAVASEDDCNGAWVGGVASEDSRNGAWAGGVASEDSCDGGGAASEDNCDGTSSGSRMIARTEMQTSECGGSASLVCQYTKGQVLPALGVATILVVTHPD
jgi:hypothetical protein